MAASRCPKYVSIPDVCQVAKPPIIVGLEQKTYCFSLGQSLSAIEIIVFVFNVLKKSLDSNTELTIKQLYLLLDEYMKHQMEVIDSQECPTITLNGDLCRPKVDYKKLFLSNLFTDFIDSQIIWIDMKKWTIALHYHCRGGRLSAVHQMLDNTLISAFEVFLSQQLTTYGPKAIDECEIRIIRGYHYVFNYLFSGQTEQNLLTFASSKKDLFEVDRPNDPKMKTCLKSKQRQLIQRRGPERQSGVCSVCPPHTAVFNSSDILRGISGRVRVSKGSDNNDWHIVCDSLQQSIVIDSDVMIYGQYMDRDWQLEEVIHDWDRVVFDARLDSTRTEDDNNNNQCWSVVQITKVIHTAVCYTLNTTHLSKFFH